MLSLTHYLTLVNAIKKVGSLYGLGRTIGLYGYMQRMKLWSYRVCVNESQVGRIQLMLISLFSLFHFFTTNPHSPCSSQGWLLSHVLHMDLSTLFLCQPLRQFLTVFLICEHSS